MFDFISRRKYWYAFSGSLILIGICAMIFNGFVHGKVMNFGIDFTGGTLIGLRFPVKLSEHEVRAVLSKFKVENSVIQKAGEQDFYIRSEPMETELRTKIMDEMKAKYGNVELLEVDTVGPIIGKELRTQALWALLLASIGIIIYVSIRFEFKYAVAAVVALYHDAFITTGLIALFWRNVETPFIAAILTILGYSINDTIVIFDRIRENLKKLGGKKKTFSEIINLSISETMARSINTVLTVIIMVLALLFFGGETLKDFSLVLLIGFILGGYSSIFIASPIIAVWEGINTKK